MIDLLFMFDTAERRQRPMIMVDVKILHVPRIVVASTKTCVLDQVDNLPRILCRQPALHRGGWRKLCVLANGASLVTAL